MSVKSQMVVSAQTDVHNLADSIRQGFHDGAATVELNAIGAAAVNQAVKAMAIARRQYNLPLVMAPSFTDVERDGVLITGIKLTVLRGTA